MSLDFRRDNRSVEVFADNIRDFNERENIWAEAYRLHLTGHGHNTNCKAHGVDMSGKLIKGKLRNHNEDFIFNVDGIDIKVEIKTIPEHNSDYMTFKTHALYKCIENDSRILVPKLNEHWVFGPKACKAIIENCPAQIYERFSPNNLANRMYSDFIDQLIDNGICKHNTWHNDASDFILKHRGTLTRGKTR